MKQSSKSDTRPEHPKPDKAQAPTIKAATPLPKTRFGLAPIKAQRSIAQWCPALAVLRVPMGF